MRRKAIRIKGKLYRNGITDFGWCDIRIAPTGAVSIRSDSGSSYCDFDDINISNRVSNTSRWLTIDNNKRIETRNNRTVDRLLGHHRRDSLSRWLHRLETKWSSALTCLVLTVGLLVGFSWFVVPQLAGLAQQALPDQYETAIGNKAREFLKAAGVAQ